MINGMMSFWMPYSPSITHLQSVIEEESDKLNADTFGEDAQRPDDNGMGGIDMSMDALQVSSSGSTAAHSYPLAWPEACCVVVCRVS
jgi:hypothetical protein